MANDGNAMAADGSAMALEGDEAPGVPQSGSSSPADSKLPFADGKEPSDDGKRMASDGSRAPAHRAISKEIAPTPVPTPSSRSKDSPSESPPRAKAARATRIPDDFAVTAEMAEWARREVPVLIAAGRGQSETDRFIDHWRQAAGPTSKKLDWVAAWRNWMRRADDDCARAGGRTAPGESTATVKARAGVEAGLRVQAMIDERNRP